MRLLMLGLLALLMGCSEGENNILYPGAPIVSIKKTKLEDNTLFFRIEAQEPVPYDIEVRVEGTRGPDKSIGESIEMRSGRSVIGTDIYLGRNDITLTLWIEPWHGSGDAPYNVGSPSRLTVAYDAPVQIVRTKSDSTNNRLLKVDFNKPPRGLSVEGASEYAVLDTKVVITGRGCSGTIILMWNGGEESLRYNNCPPPRPQLPPLPATKVTTIDPPVGAIIPPNQQFSLRFDQGITAVTVNGTAATGSGLNWTAEPFLEAGEVILNVVWTNRDGSTGSQAIGPYIVRDE